MDDLISRAEAIKEIEGLVATMSVCLSREECNGMRSMKERAIVAVKNLPTAIIMCKDCEYGKQDDEGWWYCRDLGCMMGDADGSGFCSDAERRNDECH